MQASSDSRAARLRDATFDLDVTFGRDGRAVEKTLPLALLSSESPLVAKIRIHRRVVGDDRDDHVGKLGRRAPASAVGSPPVSSATAAADSGRTS